MKKKILICGHKSFAARGLDDLLRLAGHDVVCFTRGKNGKDGETVYGSVKDIDANPYLKRQFDCVINYILLKDENVDENVVFVKALLNYCKINQVKHLVHISSISVYKASESIVNEDSTVETDINKKGAYASLKVATENYIVENIGSNIKLSLLRPGFVLGEGLLDPIVGTGLRTPHNGLLVLGNAASHIPLISREQLNCSVAKIVNEPPEKTERLLLADKNSPTKKAYLEACNTCLGVGARTDSVPVQLWMTAAAAGEAVTRVLGKRQMKVYTKIHSLCRYQEFHPEKTEARLGITFDLDWKPLLGRSLNAQQVNYAFPDIVEAQAPLQFSAISYLGFGRIVAQKHLPALEALKYKGELHPYDLSERIDDKGRKIRSAANARFDSREAVVVASPGPAHAEAIDLLKDHLGSVLVEKPLCTTPGDLDRWLGLEQVRKKPIIVCHNYRFKDNVLKMLEHLKRYNSGKLLHVSMIFQSPPVANDSAVWLRKERFAKTLLMDYSIHFIDLACLLAEGEGAVSGVEYELDSNGHTAFFNSEIIFSNCRVELLARQGFIPRKACIVFTFQNYALSLGFFPDTFVSHMTSDGFGLHGAEATASIKATTNKIIDKLSNRDSDISHGRVYQELAMSSERGVSSISVSSLQRNYRVLFELTRAIYGK